MPSILADGRQEHNVLDEHQLDDFELDDSKLDLDQNLGHLLAL
jgi:hypothetical protein